MFQSKLTSLVWWLALQGYSLFRIGHCDLRHLAYMRKVSFMPDQQHPQFASQDETHLVLSGDWIAKYGTDIEQVCNDLALHAEKTGHITLDVSGVGKLDTLGAWVIDRMRHRLQDKKISIELVQVSDNHAVLLKNLEYRHFQNVPKPHHSRFVDFLVDVGKGLMDAGRNFNNGVAFLGEVIVAMGRLAVHPSRIRLPSFVHHLEQIAFRGVPIITLISFLVGCIVAQQGIFQLQRFGAATFVVNLVGILVLRELGVLLTSIMVAGRSGSAFTAEIGSMKMREEIDALKVMGLDPIEVLIVPRILALIVGLPILSFLSSLAALFGAGLVSWFYGDLSPDIYLSRLQSAVQMKTFMVGIIKAPFMALVIGIIASMEGLAVKGSAESLGRQVTASVVKAIFMVIVLDGLFAMFFAAIKF